MKKILMVLLGLFMPMILWAQQPPQTFRNPIISGFHPDPSICRVGEDYYLANSSFEWFPGVPIYHSKDLVNWEVIGYALHRKEQLPELIDTKTSRGIYAPTLRYHGGLFYMITTCVSCGGNFYVTAENPAGPWSDPVWLEDAKGIDPSLFWDEDGRCWYTGAGRVKQLAEPWKNQNGVWLQELDLKQGKLVGEKYQLTHGHGATAQYTEGPHLYKINGRYMLMVAEGGTGFNHAITVFESDHITGPYTPSQVNPVLTHRHLGKDYPINTIGHGDLVQTQHGDWWAVMLGKRQVNGSYLLARETFLTPVSFENRWPVFNPGTGKVLELDKRPDLPWSPIERASEKDEFETSQLRLEYNFLRTPQSDWYSIRNGKLAIKLRSEQCTDEQANPSMIVRRIEDHHFTASTALEFKTKNENEVAGLVAFRNAECHYSLTLNGKILQLTKVEKGKVETVAKVPYTHKKVVLQVSCAAGMMTFYYGESEEKMTPIEAAQTASTLADETSGGFNGPYIGIYASSQGKPSNNTAYFDWFEYRKFENEIEN
ncbi:glycoside hydrolase family 43 protein [Limibacter armeniacum]|uniref:glycoside hydrolase family 43 protein n=1 Tax=Limibacter armeniacum TaxID=466084 RepID=UPI002FE537D7